MKAMVLEKDNKILQLKEINIPSIREDELLLKVLACGVCRTDLHIIDRELPEPHYPLIPGHQIVGKVEKIGFAVKKFKIGDRVGVPWLGYACGNCPYCLSERENLCDFPIFTGYTCNGGYAEYAVANENFTFPLSENILPEQQAPLLCAGLIGYRSYKMAMPFESIGFYGFGSSAHLLLQIANYHKKKVFVFTRPGDDKGQSFARSQRAFWAGSSLEMPPELLDAAIIFASVGALIPQALKSVKKGGKVITAGIHMSDIPSFPYNLLWEERLVQSVANLTRNDGGEFLNLAEKIPINVIITTYPLEDANKAIQDVREGKIEGSAILTP